MISTIVTLISKSCQASLLYRISSRPARRIILVGVGFAVAFSQRPLPPQPKVNFSAAVKCNAREKDSPFEALQLTSSRSFGVAFYFACNFSDVATVVDHTRRNTYAYCYHEHSVIYLGDLLAYGIRLGSS